GALLNRIVAVGAAKPRLQRTEKISANTPTQAWLCHAADHLHRRTHPLAAFKRGTRAGGAPDGLRRAKCEALRARNSRQKTGVSFQTPQTSRRASHISPIVTYAFAASMIGGIRFRSSWAASSFSRASAALAAAGSRRSRRACTRSIDRKSVA